jgi:hypothetical protein
MLVFFYCLYPLKNWVRYRYVYSIQFEVPHYWYCTNWIILSVHADLSSFIKIWKMLNCKKSSVILRNSQNVWK